MPKKPPKTHIQYRDAKTGEFIKEEKAKKMDPAKVIKERVPNPGHGDTKGRK